jgi:hypothetical protein
MDDTLQNLPLDSSCNENTGRIEHTITTLQKYTFIMNALEKGWRIKKRNKKYIFTKKHKGKKTFFMRGFLEKFITGNILMTPETEMENA